LFAVTILLAWFSSAKGAQRPERRRFFPPEWQKGDWWEVESVVMVGREKNPELPPRVVAGGVPRQLTVFRVVHRFTVRELAEVAGDTCYVLDIRPAKLPPRVRDDSGGSPLRTLYIRKQDGSVARNAWTFRGGVCGVTGPIDMQGQRDYVKEPRIPRSYPGPVRLDVPLLKMVTDPPVPLPERAKGMDYRTPANVTATQRVEVVEDMVFGKRQPVVVVTICLKELAERRVHKWVSGYPWCLTWESWGTEGQAHGGAMRSRLIKYGSADEEGSQVPTPEWW
jgi:hypothetical protein